MAGVLAESPGSDRGVDFFTVPTVAFKLLYCFFVIEHGRRKILHCNVTRHPTAEWIVRQLRETFPETCPYRYVILDRDSKFDDEVITFLTATGLKPWVVCTIATRGAKRHRLSSTRLLSV